MISQKLLPLELVTLVESSVELHLTGSRFFGHNTPSSDYDFFCKDTPENRIELGKNLNWSSLTDWISYDITNLGHYDDENITETWRHYGRKVVIDVQFVRDTNLKIEVQRYLKDFPFPSIEKKFHGMIWDWVYRKIRKQNEETERLRLLYLNRS